MKLALIGYGKMGKEIEHIAASMGHEIVLKINRQNLSQFTSENLIKADAAIEFTQPAAAFFNISKCFDSGIPVVTGTTGWYDQLNEVKELCMMKNGSILHASNFSIGVNLFFELNRKLAKLMRAHNDYKVSLEEIHHTQKLDKPSGTAITLANDIIAASELKKIITINDSEKNDKEKLFINSVRKENIVGTHSVNYQSEIDSIKIKHEAFSRKGFAQGAVLAAKWLIGRKGFFQMKDFLNEV
ncbi:MAG: 4-hydroxy-tetrahydrodipicolinate reductase [Bacteroidota bacterium]